ncbi:hypothetical protein ACIBHX_02195 [Nonomuraea sp. NPDC050536]|uniref:hypothetical protein n=1 Tax=Nonomuraea sp. NPDC050536 TaxID=3364366 RepID=UPI0037C88402
MSWTAQAEVLADTTELGADIALMAGRCRATGLDPRSFAPIMGAAMALGSRPWHVMDSPYGSDQELISDLLDKIDDLYGRFMTYIKLRSAITRAWAWANASFATAACQKPPNQAAMEHWARVRGDCEAALETLHSLPRKVTSARTSLTMAPAEMGETYQAVYDLLSQGRVMPHDGRWLTGEELPC